MCDGTQQVELQPKPREPLYDRSIALIPDGSQTASKSANRFVQGVYPKFAVSAKGCRVTCDDNKEYIDTVGALGPILLGYRYDRVDDAVCRQIKESGMIFSIPHALETEVAELIREMNPPVEMVRFFKNGSDANNAAIKLARAYTGRMAIAVCKPGYFGNGDWFQAGEQLNGGIPDELKDYLYPFDFNDPDSLRGYMYGDAAFSHDIAAVIIEQGLEEPKSGFYDEIRQICDEHKILLILDEVVTGFRWGTGGARKHYGIDPDIIAFGKAVAGGMPLSVVAGKRKYIKRLAEDVFYSTTFGGDCAALAAARETLTILKTEPVIPHIWEMGKLWMDGFNEQVKARGLEDTAFVLGHPPRSVVKFKGNNGQYDDAIRAVFMQECLKSGVFFGIPIFPSYSWTKEDVATILKATDHALDVVKTIVQGGYDPRGLLEGEMPKVLGLRR